MIRHTQSLYIYSILIVFITNDIGERDAYAGIAWHYDYYIITIMSSEECSHIGLG